MKPHPLPKGFVMWANEEKSAFYWTDGKDVYRASASSVPDVSTGYVPGRWESTVAHWNHYREVFFRPFIETI